MSRREAVLKATAAALQAKGFDLTTLKKRSLAEQVQSFKIRPEDAAGAMGMSAGEWREDPSDVLALKGDALPPIMLRLKYAHQQSEELYIKGATALLAKHYKRPPDLLRAIAMTAIFEWCNDACPKCRDANPRPLQPTYCLDCGQTKAKDDAGRDLGYITGQPAPGCRKCVGTGRIFSEDKRRPRNRGMVCSTCNNRGRRYFSTKQRWSLVSQLFMIDLAIFTNRWSGRYLKLILTLRSIDKNLVQGIDTQLRNLKNSRIEPFPVEEPEADECGGGPQH